MVEKPARPTRLLLQRHEIPGRIPTGQGCRDETGVGRSPRAVGAGTRERDPDELIQMSRRDQSSMPENGITRITIPSEATRPPNHQELEAMGKRRSQHPTPFKEGQYWWLRVWDTSATGSRKRQRI